MRKGLGWWVLGGALSVAQAGAPPTVTYKAAIIGFVDGDTLDVEVKLWPGVKTDDARVRLRGIDTPELFHPGCPEEGVLGKAAKDKLIGLVTAQKGMNVWLVGPSPDKYGERVDATVILADGTDLSAALIAAGVAKPWGGRGPKPKWCP